MKQVLLKSFLLWSQFLGDRLLLFISTIFLLLIGQKSRNSGCDWFIQLSDSRCPTTAFSYRTLSDKVMIMLSD